MPPAKSVSLVAQALIATYEPRLAGGGCGVKARPMLRKRISGQDAIERSAASTRNRFALGVLCLAPFLGVFDTTAVVIALPSIQRDLGFTGSSVQWVLNGYTLALGGLLLLGGRLADVLGRRRTLMAGMAFFALASIGAGLAGAPWMLVAARIMQGIGAAAMGPAALSLAATTFPELGQRNRAIGIFGAMAAVGWIAGTALGGALTELLSWRWVLFAGAPVALAGVLLAPRFISESRDPDMPNGLDLTGALMVTSGAAALIYALSKFPARGWDSPETSGVGAIGVVLLAGFVGMEARSTSPLVPLSIFRSRAIAVANCGMLLTACAAIAQLYVLTLYFQEVLGKSPLKAGLLFLPAAIAGIAFAPIAGAAVNRLGGVRPTSLLGLVVMGLGLVVAARLPEDGGPLLAVAAAVVIEIGFELTSVPLTIAATTNAPHHRQGVAAGLLQTTSNLGNATGLAVIASVIALAASDDLIIGLRQGLVVAVAFSAMAAVLVLIALPNHPRQDAEAAADGRSDRALP
ncbi:MAG TPA: MFS transporter [Thermomicrobiales bacterium]|nr:MFS transporter [Thermomicrobiales bacterium]